MKRISTLLAGSLVFAATSSWALGLGTNITMFDGKKQNADWHRAGEDEEVEPGMAHGQQWDLEAFMFDGTELSIVGGYNFKNGQQDFMSGDIFLDIDGLYGSQAEPGYSPAEGNTSVQRNFGYEYVLDLRFTSGDEGSYNVYALGDDTWVTTAYYSQNEMGDPGSNPWRYDYGGTQVGETGTFMFYEGLGDSDVAGQTFLGDTHYALAGFDLSFLEGKKFTSHFTMQCGNDNLIGSTAPVPEPATMLLLGTGLTGLAGIARRRTKRES